MVTRTLEMVEGKHDKFWTVTVEGARFHVKFGRRGTDGQVQTKEFGSDEAAKAACEKLVQEKLRKGYKEVASDGCVAPISVAALAAAVSSPPPPEGVAPRPPALRHELRLGPADWALVTYKEREVLALEPPGRSSETYTMWDSEVQRFHERFFKHDTDLLTDRLAPNLGPEDAQFWLLNLMVALSTLEKLWSSLSTGFDHSNAPGRSAKAAQEIIRQVDLSRRPEPEEVIRHGQGAQCDAVFFLLSRLYPIEEAIRICRLLQPGRRGLLANGDLLPNLLLPYLTADEHRVAQQAIREWFLAEQGEGNEHRLVYQLAAQFGLHEEVWDVVRNWPDKKFAAQGWGTHYQYPHMLVFGLGSAAHVSSEFHRLGLRTVRPWQVKAWLAHTELRELDVPRDSAIQCLSREDAAAVMGAFAESVISPEAAPFMLDLMFQSKAPQVALRWLNDHVPEAIEGLLPVAAGRGKTAESAQDLLRGWATGQYADAVRTALATQPEAIAEKLHRELFLRSGANLAAIDRDAMPAGLMAAFVEAARGKLPKLPDWLQAQTLPPIVIGRPGEEPRRLGEEWTAGILHAAARTEQWQQPHYLLFAIRCYATPESLDRFAWSMFERWLTAGAPSKEKFGLYLLSVFGSDASAVKLTAYVRQWPGEGKHQTAAHGLEVLRGIGTDAALMQINGISQKAKFQAIKARAGECIREIADERGLSAEELEDRIVPDCGLDERGTRVFDFGPRQFHLAIGADLKPVILDSDNNRKPDLPKPGAKDDAQKAESAVAEWKVVRKQVAEVAKMQAHRLEMALTRQRRWKPQDFETLMVRNPLLINLMRPLVWAAYDSAGKVSTTFRITEDSTYADEHDSAVALPQLPIGLVHPLQMTQASLENWGQLLADYALAPAFQQLSRPVYKPTTQELSSDRINRYEKIVLEPLVMAGILSRLGWTRGVVQDGGSFGQHYKQFPVQNVTAMLQHGFMLTGMIQESDPPEIGFCYFVKGLRRADWDASEPDVLIKDVEPVVMSEILRDLAVLASKEKA